MRKITKARTAFSLVALSLMAIICLSLMCGNTAQAASEGIAKKWIFAMHYNCISSSVSSRDISIIDAKKEGLTIAQAVYRRGSYFDADTSNHQSLPNYQYIKNAPETINCRETLFGNYGNTAINGVLEVVGYKDVKDLGFGSLSNSGEVLTKLGYNPSNNSSADIQIQLNTEVIDNKDDGKVVYQSNTNDQDSATIHAEMENGQATYNVISGGGGSDWVHLELNKARGTNKLTVRVNKAMLDLLKNYNPALKDLICENINNRTSFEQEIELSSNIDEAIRKIELAVNDVDFKYRCTPLAGDLVDRTATYTMKIDSARSDGYSLGDNKSAAADESLNRLGNPRANLQLEPEERYDLYTYYIQNAIPNFKVGAGISCTQDENHTKEIHLQSGGRWTKYYLNVSGIDLDARIYKDIDIWNGNNIIVDKSLNDIIGWLEGYSGGPDAGVSYGAGETCPTPDMSEAIGGVIVSSDDPCFGAAGSLGWILCPILTKTGEAVNTLYEKIISPMLEIRTASFNQNEGVYGAWQLFQSFANIVFVILFLVVVISQLTGIGIDNLGIKRILPKLIIAAVLVNLSYIICMLLVDASNIAGYGIYHLFDNIKLGGNEVGRSSNLISTLLTGTGVLAAGAGAVVTVWAWGAPLLLGLLLGLIGILIGILTMFVMLGVYQAGVIVAVIVSPIAFVLYMLPNTKSIFDRWKKLFQGLLLLYPICGLMMGGSAFISKVMINVAGDTDGGFWFTLLGALLSIIPFFFIPTILKNSMAAMGNIGAKISGIGKNASNKARGAVTNSEAVKDWQARSKAGVRSDGSQTLAGRMRSRIAKSDGLLGRAAQRSAARGGTAYLKRREELGNAKLASQPDFMSNKMKEQDARLYEKQLATAQSNVENSDAYLNGNFKSVGNDLAKLLDSDVDGENAVGIQAAVNALSKKQEAGRNVVSDVLANRDFSKMSSKAQIALGRAISGDKNFQDYKDNRRSTLKLAQELTSTEGKFTGNAAQFEPGGSDAVDIQEYKPEQYAKMDDDEFAKHYALYESLKAKGEDNLNDTEKRQLATMQEIAYKAYTNDKLMGSAKTGGRGKMLEKMASGYKPKENTVNNNEDAKEGESFNIHSLPTDHDGNDQ